MKKPTLLLLLATCLSVPTWSQAMYKVPLSEKSAASTLIFEGTVASSLSRWNETHTMIYTVHQVRPSRIFKGLADRGTVEVMTIGGQVENFFITASELLTLEKGETGVFFCRPNPSGIRSAGSGRVVMDIYSSAQGFIKYDLATGKASSPFEQMRDIESVVYPELEKSTGRASVQVDPSFSLALHRSPVVAKVMAPAITGFSPASVIAGKFSDPASNTLTINGSGFGTPGGSARVAFDDADDGAGGAVYNVSSTSDLVASWTDTQIILKVPGKAGTGNFTVYDAANAGFTSPTPLEVSWAMLTQVGSQSPSNLMYSLFDDNGTGGYSYYYSTSTANSGADFSTSAQEAPFSRAITTWRELTGLNFTYGGLTNTQQLNLGDGINLVMLDNTANGPSFVLPAGVLAVCYSGGYTCNGSQWILRAGFEIIIRNAGVSAGSATFNNGPCFTTGSSIDMESVILHELGHALNLGHIIDSYKGSGLPNIDPQKVMNFAIVNGVDRRSPDWAALAGARYNVNPRGLAYCYGINEMVPLPGVVNEAKDDCPLLFPSSPTTNNTSVNFDLHHAGSNRFNDPQYTRVFTNGAGTSITNNAWYVFRTDGTGNSISLAISNYVTVPASQSSCTNAGVELSFYQVNSCPAGQAFPAPVAYRTFNANGPVTAVTGLSPNTTYLMMADGIFNTRASFTMTYIGTVLPLRFLGFNAVKDGAEVRLDWQVISEKGNDHFEVMRSRDGRNFTSIATIPSHGDNENRQLYSAVDDQAFTGINYYRIRQVDIDGRETFSKTVSVTAGDGSGISIYPNPARARLFIHGSGATTPLRVSLYTITGSLVKRNELKGARGAYELDLQGLPAGSYIVEVQTSSGVQQQRFIKE